MKKVDEKFMQAVSLLFSQVAPKNAVIGTVESLSMSDDTCKVSREGSTTLFKVRLNAVIDTIDNKIVVYPAVGSKVLCIIIENDKKEAAIVKYGEIDSVSIKIGDSIYLVDNAGHKIERGDNNLNDLLADFIAEVQKIIVVQGTSPDVAALEDIKTKIGEVLKS